MAVTDGDRPPERFTVTFDLSGGWCVRARWHQRALRRGGQCFVYGTLPETVFGEGGRVVCCACRC